MSNLPVYLARHLAMGFSVNRTVVLELFRCELEHSSEGDAWFAGREITLRDVDHGGQM